MCVLISGHVIVWLTHVILNWCAQVLENLRQRDIPSKFLKAMPQEVSLKIVIFCSCIS